MVPSEWMNEWMDKDDSSISEDLGVINFIRMVN
jgi:hypothetical protein